MFKKLTVKDVSGEQREFAERTANVACKQDCLALCDETNWSVEVNGYMFTELLMIGACN